MKKDISMYNLQSIKKYILLLALAFASMYHAQALPTSTENYIYTKVYLSEDGSKKSETVQYFDGLGRPKQLIQVKATPQGQDLVTPIVYDNFGRQSQSVLPIPTATANLGIQNVSVASANSYYGVANAYAEQKFEASPLGRVLESAAPGTDWAMGAGHTQKMQYDVNKTSDRVKKYTITSTWQNAVTVSSLPAVSFYSEKVLTKTSGTDEDGQTTIEFKNGLGQTVLVRKVLNSQNNADTYYIYNDYGHLIYVISPKADEQISLNNNTITQKILDDLCYQYVYDNKHRMVEKKLPGKGREYMVYDKQNRLVLTRDANLEAQGKWLFTKYDRFSRPIYTGIVYSPQGRAQQVAAVEGLGANNEVRTTSGFNNTGMDVFYTANSAYPQYDYTLLSVSYYDSYPTYSFNPAFPSSILGEPTLTETLTTEGLSTKNLLVMSLVKNIEDDNWTKSYIYYDKKRRAIGSYSINHFGGRTQTESKLDFAGAVQQNITRHKRLNTDTDKVITENFTYDAQNRLLSHTHQVGNNPVEYLSRNSYNELSQLSGKKIGGGSPAIALQDISYTYNIRGWMTKINDPKNLSGKLFGYEIKYNQVEGQQTPDPFDTNLKVLPKYNGNMAEVDWRTNTSSGDYLRRYGYVYDNMNRLSAGFYQREDRPSAQEYFEKMAYDLNGNITNLKRTASLNGNTAAGLIDNLTYIYANNNSSNRLTTVTDSSTDYRGYPDISGIEIGYDDNGNMTSHQDKGILQIDYNFLNLPKYVRFDQVYIPRNFARPVNIRSFYQYNALGEKIRKIYYHKNPVGSGEESITTDYLNSFQYESKQLTGNTPIVSLKFAPTSEGYFDFEKNKYIYNYIDHLGNVRLSYFNNGTGVEVLEENNYYPFGLKHEGYNALAGNSSYQYQYNGKELQETGMYDYGARFYMPDIGRWGVVDPLAEASRRFSPYVYGNNNPVRFTDPDGRQSWDNLTSYNPGSAVTSFMNRNGFGGENLPMFYNDDAGIMIMNQALGNDGEGGGGLAGTEATYEEALAFLYFGNINFSSPPNEFIVDMKTGQVTQVSNLGGDEIDFYHYVGGGAGFNGKTRIVDRESGEDQWMNSSKNLKGYTRRSNSTNWGNLYDEFLSGGGPENSLLTMGNAAVNQLMKTNMYKSAVQYFQGTSMNEKTSYSGTFGPLGVALENSNMQGQFMGKTNFSFYPVGNKVVIMAFDSKSISSYSLNPFNKSESRNIPRFNGVGVPESTTRQTYLLWVNKNNMLKK
jgi:RHS repeat-associated protein